LRGLRSSKIPSFHLKKVKTNKLAAHLEVAHGTLVCRGTPVEKHWSRSRVAKFFLFAGHFKNLLGPSGHIFEKPRVENYIKDKKYSTWARQKTLAVITFITESFYFQGLSSLVIRHIH
jgi:hypothetical protein